jgi:hypothetical protein
MEGSMKEERCQGNDYRGGVGEFVIDGWMDGWVKPRVEAVYGC